MTDELKSYPFDFDSVNDFFTQWNIKFKLSDMTGASNKFQLVLASTCPNNIEQCLTNGSLNNNVTIYTSQDVKLTWDNSQKTISITDNVTFNLSTNTFSLKAVFLRNKSNGYVMGYSINENAVSVTNKVIFDKDTILWSIE